MTRRRRKRRNRAAEAFVMTLALLLPAAAIVILLSLYVFSIRGVTLTEIPEEGVTLTRYTEDVEETVSARAERSNDLASEKVSYKSSDPEVAEVSKEGTITGKNPGIAVITVRAKGNPFVKTSFPVTVVQKALSMQVAFPEEIPSNEYYHLLHTGDTVSFEALPDPLNALVENITYESSNPDVVTITEDGVIEAHKGGISEITVSWVGPYTEEGQQEILGDFLVNVCRSTTHDKLADHELQWYEESCLVAHALGNAGEYTYTNTLDALEESISEGFRNLEVDLSLTSDGEVVCRHTWYSDDFDVSYNGKVPDLATFEKEKYFGTLTPLTGRKLLEVWSEHPELYFITDVKQDEVTDLYEVMEKFVSLAKEMGKEELLDHLIVQLYNISDYDKINAIYPIKHWIFTTYQLPETPGAEVEAAEYSDEMNFGAFTVPAWCMTNDYFIDLANANHLALFVHVLDTRDQVYKAANRGMYGFYTDYISPNDPEGETLYETLQ